MFGIRVNVYVDVGTGVYGVTGVCVGEDLDVIMCVYADMYADVYMYANVYAYADVGVCVWC